MIELALIAVMAVCAWKIHASWRKVRPSKRYLSRATSSLYLSTARAIRRHRALMRR